MENMTVIKENIITLMQLFWVDFVIFVDMDVTNVMINQFRHCLYKLYSAT